MKKNILIILGIIIIIGGGIITLRVLSGDEDTWLCENGQWVKHGNPVATKPTTICNNDSNSTNQLLSDTWICDGAQWVKQGDPTGPKPTEVCDEEHSAISKNDNLEFNWSTMNEGPYRDNVTYATGTDLLNWEPSGEILATHASVPGAVIKDGTIFVYFVDVSEDGLKEQLGMVKSTDQGKTWSDQNTLTIDGLGEKATADPDPVLLANGRIRLYYFDINEPRLDKPDNGVPTTNKIYSAISEDGINFTQENGVRFERVGIFDPDVNLFNNTWYLYGGDIEGNQVVYATSTDGLTFKEGGVAYNGGAVPDVFEEGGLYYLFTAGINIATGVTPTSFTDSGSSFHGTSVTADPSVIKLENGNYIMLYKTQT